MTIQVMSPSATISGGGGGMLQGPTQRIINLHAWRPNVSTEASASIIQNAIQGLHQTPTHTPTHPMRNRTCRYSPFGLIE